MVTTPSVLNPPVALAITDTDADGMDDGWEVTYFGDLTRDGTGDFDGDGMTDLEEYDNAFTPDVDDGFEDPDGDRYPSVFELRNTSDPLASSKVPAPTYEVDWAGGGDYTGIAAAVNAANVVNGQYQIILVAPGTYSGSANTVVFNAATDPHLLIIGAAGAASTVIDGGQSTTRWNMSRGGVVSSLTFQNFGLAPLRIQTSGGEPFSVIDTIIRDNIGTFAGGVEAWAGTGPIHLVGGTMFNNQSTASLAAHIYSYQDLFLRNTVLGDAGAQTPIVFAGSASLDAEFSLVVGMTLSGTGNLSDSTDPLLNRVGRVQTSSPLIAAGGSGPYSALDMDLEPRSVSSPGIGADEWVDTDADDLADAWELIHAVDLTVMSGQDDGDSDGLDNVGEAAADTDPGKADTDNDGVSDGEEVLSAGTNPHAVDSDGDGMDDLWEITFGLAATTANAYEDDDHDRYPNVFEYIGSTDPTTATSIPAPDYIVDPIQGGMSGVDNIYEGFNEAVAQAQTDGGTHRVILAKAGLYTGPPNTNVDIESSGPTLLVMGESGAAQTIIDGNGLYAGWKSRRRVILESLSFQRLRYHSIVLFTASGSRLLNIRSVDNVAFNFAGGLNVTGAGEVLVANSSFINNSAIGGGAAAPTHIGTHGADIILSNTVFWSAIPGAAPVSSSGTIVADYSLVAGYVLSGTSNFANTVDPLVRSDGRLLPSSPLIGAGGGAALLRPDMDLESRTASYLDVGADAWFDGDADGLPDSWELIVAGNLTTLAGTGDADSDGVTDLEEYETTAPGAAADPLDDDTDGDTLLDGQELTLGTDMLVPDALDVDGDHNGDGLDDSVGLSLGVHPFDNDVDGDGVLNTDEIALGLDPLNPDTDGDGYSDSVDAFPHDPWLHELPIVPGDTTAPTITLVRPANAVLQ